MFQQIIELDLRTTVFVEDTNRLSLKQKATYSKKELMYGTYDVRFSSLLRRNIIVRRSLCFYNLNSHIYILTLLEAHHISLNNMYNLYVYFCTILLFVRVLCYIIITEKMQWIKIKDSIRHLIISYPEVEIEPNF